MKDKITSWLGHVFNPREFALNTVMLIFCALTITGGRMAVQATPTSDVKWIEVFEKLPSWTGWFLLFLTLDSWLFRGKLLSATIKATSKVTEPILKSVVGEEKFNKMVQRLKRPEEEEDTKD